MKRMVSLVCWMAVWAFAGRAQEPASPTVPCKFYPIPVEYGVVSMFDALLATEDGKVYLGPSTYNHPAPLIELDRATGRFRAVASIGQTAPQDDRAFITQSKVHTFLNRSSADVIYFGTHTGEPDEYCEGNRMYLGGHFMAYDRKTGLVTDYGVGRARDSLMRVSLDEKRGKLYGMTYPAGHLVVCDMKARTIQDMGKASLSAYSNPWVMWDGKVYFNSRHDEFSCFDPDTGEIKVLPVRLPDIGGEAQQLAFRSFQARTRDLKRLYASVKPGGQLLEWDLSSPPGKMRYLGGQIDPHSMVLTLDENTLYVPTWGGDLYKYDFRRKKFYSLGFPSDGGRRIGGLYGACAAPDGKLFFGGNAMSPDGKRTVYGAYGYAGFWEYDPAVEPALEKEVFGKADPAPRGGRKQAPKTAPGAGPLLVIDVNSVIPYGESSMRAMVQLPSGDMLGATVGKRAHLVLIGNAKPEACDLGLLPEGEYPAYGGLAIDRNGFVYLGTVGDLETIYRKDSTPPGKIYRVVLNERKTKAEFKRVATPFAEDGVYCMAMDPAGANLYGVTFPGGKLFGVSLADNRVTDYGALVSDTRPQNKDSCAYNWMNIRVGRQIVFDAKGNLYCSAGGLKLRSLSLTAGETKPVEIALAVPGEGVDALILGGDGNLYGGTDRGYLFLYDPENRKTINLGKPTQQPRMRALCWSNDRLFGICGEPYGRCLMFSYRAGEGFALPSMLFPNEYMAAFVNDFIDVLLPGSDGCLWLGGAGRMTTVMKIQHDAAKARDAVVRALGSADDGARRYAVEMLQGWSGDTGAVRAVLSAFADPALNATARGVLVGVGFSGLDSLSRFANDPSVTTNTFLAAQTTALAGCLDARNDREREDAITELSRRERLAPLLLSMFPEATPSRRELLVRGFVAQGGGAMRWLQGALTNADAAVAAGARDAIAGMNKEVEAALTVYKAYDPVKAAGQESREAMEKGMDTASKTLLKYRQMAAPRVAEEMSRNPEKPAFLVAAAALLTDCNWTNDVSIVKMIEPVPVSAAPQRLFYWLFDVSTRTRKAAYLPLCEKLLTLTDADVAAINNPLVDSKERAILFAYGPWSRQAVPSLQKVLAESQDESKVKAVRYALSLCGDDAKPPVSGFDARDRLLDKDLDELLKRVQTSIERGEGDVSEQDWKRLTASCTARHVERLEAMGRTSLRRALLDARDKQVRDAKGIGTFNRIRQLTRTIQGNNG